MERDLQIMTEILEEKDKELAHQELIPLNAEGKRLGEHKRFTFDVIDTPADPLR